MNNFKILKELIKRFQGVRAVLYFAEIIGMGVADGISVVLVSRIIGIITDTAVSKGNLRDTQLVKYIILTIIFKIIIQTLLAVLYNDEAKRTCPRADSRRTCRPWPSSAACGSRPGRSPRRP